MKVVSISNVYTINFRVIRVPETEKKGRLHSSVISIAILPELPFVRKIILLIIEF